MNFYTLLLGGSLLLAGPGRAAAQATAPPDTLPGHTRLVRIISASLCTQLQSRPAADLARLSEPDVMSLTEQLMTKAMLTDSTALIGMLQQAQQRGQDPRKIGELLGADAIRQLSGACPAALPLITRLGLTKQAQQAANADLPPLSDTDRRALQPLATGLCSQLEAANAKKPFASLNSAQRDVQFKAALQQQFAANRTQLQRHYTAAQLADERFLGELGGKVVRLMLAQPACAPFVMQLGADELGRQQTKP